MTDQVDESYLETTLVPPLPAFVLVRRARFTSRLEEAVWRTGLTVVAAPGNRELKARTMRVIPDGRRVQPRAPS